MTGKQAIRDRIVELRRVKASELIPNQANWRRHPKSQADALAGLLSEIGYAGALLARETAEGLVLIDGHLRQSLTPEATVPVLVLDVDEAEAATILATYDPVAAMAEADAVALDALMRQVQTGDAAVMSMLEDLAEQAGVVDFDDEGAGETEDDSEPTPATERKSLAERFIVPPFSVLDARQGYWQERKRAWLSLGIQSELGRGMETLGMAHPETTSTIDFYAQKRHIEAEIGHEITKDEAAAILAERGELLDARALNRARKQGGLVAAQGAGSVYAAGSDWAGARGGQQKNLTWVQGTRSLEDMDETSRKNLAGGRKGLARSDGNKLGFSAAATIRRGGVGYDGSKILRGEEDGAEAQAAGTSIFDPVLCELVYRWFSPPDGLILDPFAGGSVRGIVAASLGRGYVGIDLRPEQVEANRVQGQALTPANPPHWIVGDSLDLDRLVDGRADLVFSCPPYADLEVYSDDPHDLSTMDYPAFLAAYHQIIAQAVARLKPDRFACFVVGDIRDKAGLYRNFVSDTIAAFQDAGARLYNEAILVTAVGSLPIRVGRQFSAGRKLGKTHQNVLVFVKGDAKRATEACGPVEVELPEGLEGADEVGAVGD